MNERLERLRTEHTAAMDKLRDIEDDLVILRSVAAKAIGHVIKYEGEVERVREEIHGLEDEILRLS